MLDTILPAEVSDLANETTMHFIRRHNVKLVRGYYEMEKQWLGELIEELKVKSFSGEWTLIGEEMVNGAPSK